MEIVVPYEKLVEAARTGSRCWAATRLRPDAIEVRCVNEYVILYCLMTTQKFMEFVLEAE